MFFDDSYFENEVREGFFVASLMKRAWAAQIEVLEVINNICVDNDIEYFAAYGTLLGAVRHNGFIPWDDDIDIWMFRKDLEKFRSIIENRLPQGYIYNCVHNREEYCSSFDRLLNTNSIDFTEPHLEKYHGFPFIAGVDIFPLDTIPRDNDDELRKDLKIILDLIMVVKSDEKIKINSKILSLIKEHYNFEINVNKNIENQLWQIWDVVSARFMNNEKGSVAWTQDWIKSQSICFPRKMFIDKTKLSFENTEVPAPQMYKELLEIQYPGYSKPVMHYAELHDYPFYLKQEPLLYEKTKANITEYSISGELDSSRSELTETVTIDERIALIDNISRVILSLYETGQVDKTTELLIKEQEIVIDLGKAVEEEFNESDSKYIVELLEEYCETIYLANCSLINVVEFVDLYKKMLNAFEIIKKEILKIQNSRLYKILFVIEKEKDWEYYKEIYDRLDKNIAKCYVMPIPYYHRDPNLRINMKEMLYKGDEISKYVQIEDYKTFDFKQKSIDCIIKSNCYDEHSFGEVIHPYYFSDRLKTKCSVLINIPTIEVMDFSTDNVQMMYMSRFFVKVPGVMNSDYVILNSEINKDTYIDILRKTMPSVDWEDRIRFCKYNGEEMSKEILMICKKAQQKSKE